MDELSGNNEQLTRRRLLVLFSAGAVVCLTSPSLAEDGDSGGEGGDSGEGGSGSGSSGSGSSGGGSSGGGEGGDDDSDNDGDDDSSSGSGKGKSQDDARDALRKGEVIPLSLAITRLRDRYDGRIIDVRLTEKGSRIVYRFKVVDDDGKVTTVTMNARNGLLRGYLGF